MTPEETAKKIAAAVQAEREACAQIASRMADIITAESARREQDGNMDGKMMVYISSIGTADLICSQIRLRSASPASPPET